MPRELAEFEQVVQDLQQGQAGSPEATAIPAASTSAGAVATAVSDNSTSATVPVDYPGPRGFQSSFVAQPPWPREADASSPGFSPQKPMPKRPKGRFLIGGMLFAICLAVGWTVWDNFVGVAAYGVITGDTLRVTAPWDGQLERIHVTEGESVETGQLLATVVSQEIQRQLERTKDELSIEQAKLDAETSRIRQDAGEYAAEYFELWGSLLKNRQDLIRLEREHARAEGVGEFIAQEEVERIAFAESGLRALVEKLEKAVEERRQRAEPTSDEPEAGWKQLDPIRARITFLQSEVSRLEEQLDEGTLRAPVAGVVTKLHQVDGQRIASLETVLELVDANSLEATLFLPQDESRTLPPGTEVTLRIEPLGQEQVCTVVRTGERFEAAPAAVERYYLSNQPLMPVILRPKPAAGSPARFGIPIGAVVRLSWVNHLSIKHRETIDDLKRSAAGSRTATMESLWGERF